MTDAQGVFQFDLTSVSNTTNISKATLELRHVGPTVLQDSAFAIHQIIEEWNEGGINWDNKPKKGDRLNICSILDNVLHFDVTETVQDFIKNPSSNYGFLVSCIINMQDSYIASSEHADEKLRPKLIIEEVDVGNSDKKEKMHFYNYGYKVKVEADGVSISNINNSCGRIEIVNLLGRTLFQTNFLSSNDVIYISPRIQKGIHLLKIKNTKVSYVQKIIF